MGADLQIDPEVADLETWDTTVPGPGECSPLLVAAAVSDR